MKNDVIINGVSLSQLESTGIAAAMVAADILTDGFYSKPEIKFKTGKYDIVTPFDLKAENAIIKRISEDFPEHSFYGEENGQQGDLENQITWVIDPIDGTLNFARQIPSFSTSIACVYKGITYVAICFDPLAKELFIAKKGFGSYMNGQKLEISPVANLEDSGISLGLTVGLEKIKEIGFIRRTGSSVLDICYVGKGALEGYIEFSLNLWDFAASKLIVEEAGGKVTTINGDMITPSFKTTSSIIASNGLIHKELLQWISMVKQ